MERHLTASLSVAGPAPLAPGRRTDLLRPLQPVAGWTEVALLLCLLCGPLSLGAISSSPLGDPFKGYRQLPEEKSESLPKAVSEI